MPNCADNYENEILDGKNVNSVKCKYCGSKILNPSTAEFFNNEVIKQINSNLFPGLNRELCGWFYVFNFFYSVSVTVGSTEEKFRW